MQGQQLKENAETNALSRSKNEFKFLQNEGDVPLGIYPHRHLEKGSAPQPPYSY
jgi:hypothetical protein